MDGLINMANEDLACRMERNFITQFRLFSGINGATFTEDDVITEFVSGYNASWMNGVLKTDGSYAQLRERISETLRKYTGQYPMLWRVGALTSKPQLVREVLTENGLQFEGVDAGMALNQNQFCNSKALPEFTVHVVNKQEKVRDWLIPFAAAYSLADNVIDHFQRFMLSRVDQSKVEGWFTGYVNNLPVSSAYYLTDSGVTMIYAVGTISNSRKRGYARRTVEAAINHAWQHSSFPIALYASEMGHSLYKDMGFVDVCSLENYLFTNDCCSGQ
jgi:GNAT superfamily N-acetyltransferase